MYKRLSSYLVLCCFAALLTVGCCPKSVQRLDVTLHPQETSRWCWAASGQMVMDYLGHDVSQCIQANNRFNRNDCCTIDLCPLPTEAAPPDTDPCDCVCGGWPEFNKYGFTFNTTNDAPLGWDQLKKQISEGPSPCKGRPFCFSWHHAGIGGHMMVVKGYFSLAGTNYVVILDPWSPCIGDERILTYDTYVSPPNKTHWNDYYDITYVGGQ